MSAYNYYQGGTQLSESWDDATATYVAYEPDGTVRLSRPFTVQEQQAAQELIALALTLTNQRIVRTRAAAALLTNRTYLALAAPVGADNLAQIRALTRQNVGLLRMLLNNLDGTD